MVDHSFDHAKDSVLFIVKVRF